MEHSFTPVIRKTLAAEFRTAAEGIFAASPVLQYLNNKTRAADRGSKARSSFANLYAIYVLVEDYVKKGFARTGRYKTYEGAKFSDLFQRQRELPFGSKLQNHALNHRLNEEFHKFFPTCDYLPILRNVETNRYWFNEHLLTVRVGRRKLNIAKAVLKIIDAYVSVKQEAFSRFIQACEKLSDLEKTPEGEAIDFVTSLLSPKVDARLFEIVSYSILRAFYHGQTVFFGFQLDEIQEEPLALYKTGRTNANDGGIDFVMRPLGRFFQVTETTDVKKYFLDIDKIERYPITFVIKSELGADELKASLRDRAAGLYAVTAIVDKYMSCIEEVINLPLLVERFKQAVSAGRLKEILGEIVKQSKVEFSYDEE
jgi:hypothetical protein